jgi:hypothetical protein
VEFNFIAILLMVPLVYVIVTVSRLENAGYAVVAASREAGRAYATAQSPDIAEFRAVTAARVALADHGIELQPGQLRVNCSEDPCLTPGGWVEASLELSVPLPLVPRVLTNHGRASIRVNSTHTERIDEHWVVPQPGNRLRR